MILYFYLFQLHPHIKSWGAMLSLYGSSSMLRQKSKKKKLDEITGLQYRRTNAPAPNLAILDKLRLEMRELNR